MINGWVDEHEKIHNEVQRKSNRMLPWLIVDLFVVMIIAVFCWVLFGLFLPQNVSATIGLVAGFYYMDTLPFKKLRNYYNFYNWKTGRLKLHNHTNKIRHLARWFK